MYWIIGLGVAIWLAALIWWATKPAKPYPGYGSFRYAGSTVDNGQ